MEFTEIERKFLVLSNQFKANAHEHYRIVQGFLNSDPARVVRIRLSGEKAWITVKGMGDARGLSRFEWEKELDTPEAEALLKLCEPGRIEKTRYLVQYGNTLFEVDEFYGENAGLLIAEAELEFADQSIDLPEWLGEEVTGQKAYYNSQLAQHPYSSWKKD